MPEASADEPNAPVTALWGDDDPPDRPIRLGGWSVALRGCELADIAADGRQLLRGIRFIVRDHDWRTARNVADRVHVDEPAGILELAARSVYGERAVMDWAMRLTVDGAELTVSIRAKATAPFRRNRAGLIVLHSPALAGRRLNVIHPDGSIDETTFPTTIEPHQPAIDVAGYAWVTPDISARLHLTGDVFEMEDQRNWTDASYKTYSTPLTDPFPVNVAPGDTVEQSLTLTTGATTTSARANSEPFTRSDPFDISPVTTDPPTIQYGASTAPDEPAIAPGGPPTTILVELPADEPCWPAVLERALTDASGGQLDVRIVAGRADDVPPVIAALTGRPVLRLGVFDRHTHLSPPESLPRVRRAAAELGCEPVAGTRAHFTELNRSIDMLSDWDGALTFSMTPQMHDTSPAQIVESLAMQRVVAENAVRLAAGRALHIGPITLRPRFNAVATSPFRPSPTRDLSAGYGAELVPDATDPKQHMPAIARWRRASLAALSVPGVRSVTYFEAWGPRGVVADRASWCERDADH